ncbi:MAG: ABC transporter ATP-binding protein [Candidatus Hodarchaeota archaeon]
MDDWLIFKNLQKKYGSFEALRGISFSSNTSGVIGLIGPNGAGKTTLIRILLGLIQKNRGQCLLLGHDVWIESNILKKKVGVLLERPSYPPGLTVQQYLDCVQSLYGGISIDLDVKEWSDRLALPLDRSIGGLSAGMRRKMGLLAALTGQVEVVIMDEPTANVDPIAREEILELILTVQKQTETKFLISSHLLFDLEKIAEEVIILVDGMILEAGKTLNILKKYESSNEYTCTVVKPEKFVSVLQKQDWVLEVVLDINQIFLKTKKVDSHQIFHNILQLATQENARLLNIGQVGSLTQVFRRMDDNDSE